MIQKLKPYSAMKDSGAQWLGAVPQHWELRRLRNVCEMRVSTVDKHAIEGELPVRLCNYVDVYKNDHIRATMNFMRATATQEEIERFRLAVGDVLITKDSETWVSPRRTPSVHGRESGPQFSARGEADGPGPDRVSRSRRS